MTDVTEATRRQLVAEINTEPDDLQRLESEHGAVWTTEELQCEFEVTGFLAPFVVVRRKSDGQRGSLMFQHSPRYYFGFQEDR